MGQYSCPTCLKFCGIPESEGENTDKVVLSVINKDILFNCDTKISLYHIGRTQRVGPKKRSVGPNKCNKPPCYNFVRLISYRHRALVYSNKQNLRTRNQNSDMKIYVNEALTH